jgi:glutamine amidotransferase
MATIAVIDYDMGNLHSACKGLDNAGGHTLVTDVPEEILAADAVVLPGVGSFDPAVQHLRSRGLETTIKTVIESGKPFLGICLGLQILFDQSEEGSEPGLGWNQLEYAQPDSPLWQGLGASPWVYFVHSYYVDPIDPSIKAAMVHHGTQQITAAIARDNLMAVQFHPEKSSEAGLKLLANFVQLAEASS